MSEAGSFSYVEGFFEIDSFQLESGVTLNDLKIAYGSYGKLNDLKNNVIIVCHSLTLTPDVASWWPGLFGPGKAFDPTRYFILGINVIGSQFGSTGPTTRNPKTGRPYGPDFPKVTVLDTVKAQIHLCKQKFGIREIHCVIGPSLGGMQALEWCLEAGEYVKQSVIVCCGATISAWQIGLNELQRQAIILDPAFRDGYYEVNDPPLDGLSLARQIGLMSYRSHLAYAQKFKLEVEKTCSYLSYKGSKFSLRFDPNTYICLTKMLESHDVGRNRGGAEAALRTIIQKTLIIGISSDILYPVAEQQRLHNLIPNSILEIIESIEGHDGFLIEMEAKIVNNLVTKFLNS